MGNRSNPHEVSFISQSARPRSVAFREFAMMRARSIFARYGIFARVPELKSRVGESTVRIALTTVLLSKPIKKNRSSSDSPKRHWPLVSKIKPASHFLSDIPPELNADHVMHGIK